MVLAWPLLAPGGVMFCDDYVCHWQGKNLVDEPRTAIDAFLACYAGQYELLHKGVQVAIRKVAA